MPRISELIAYFDKSAPPQLAEDWDNTGLLLGDRTASVERAVTCLSLSPDVAREAIDQQAGLIVSHHPIFFKPVKRLTADDPQGRMLLDLAAARVAVYSAHTRFDSARDGINQWLAEGLGLKQIESLDPASAPPSYKLVVMVPRDHVAAVQRAMWDAGAGVIGEYQECSFVMPGTGSFRGTSASRPAIGTPGEFKTVDEYRVDMVCPAPLVDKVIAAMKRAHPYEETAFDIVPRRAPQIDVGVARMGLLGCDAAPGRGRAETLGDLMSRVKQLLKIDRVQFTGELSQPISRVGVACGSAGELLKLAMSRGCDAFVTGEARFHTSLEAREAGCALVLAGHYATERPAMESLAARLSEEFPGLDCWPSRVEADPVRYG